MVRVCYLVARVCFQRHLHWSVYSVGIWSEHWLVWVRLRVRAIWTGALRLGDLGKDIWSMVYVSVYFRDI